MRGKLAGGLLALPLTLALACAGCGKGDEGPGVATAGGAAGAKPVASAEAELSDSDRQIKFTECMRENGVDMPDPEPGGGVRFRMGGDMDRNKMQEAMAKCRQYLPNGGEPPKMDAEQIENMRKMAQCMRENGVPDFPDPDADGRLMIRSGEGGPRMDDDAMRAAMEKCRQLAPNMGRGARFDGGTR